MIKNFLFQMDDPTKINIKEDSTYMLIKESLSRGIRCFYNSPSWVYASINKTNQIRAINIEKIIKILILRNSMQFLFDRIPHLTWSIFPIHIYSVNFKNLF